ncbi:unnamed protein product [Rhizophagus irregularis]|nr:unnamed protein product [Rhizophagus irregularis]
MITLVSIIKKEGSSLSHKVKHHWFGRSHPNDWVQRRIISRRHPSSGPSFSGLSNSFTNFCLELCDGVSRPVPLAFPLPLLDFQTHKGMSNCFHKAKESALVSGEGEQVDAMIKEVTATL